MEAFWFSLAFLFAPEIPALIGRVVDRAGLFSPEQRQQLEQRLEREERETSVQILIATIPSLEGEPLEVFSVRLAEAWRIGQAGLDNGIILLVAREERRVRIEVGYGLEPVIPDGLAGRIIRERIAPSFRAGDFYGGVAAAVEGLSLAARRQYPPATGSAPGRVGAAPGLAVRVISVLPEVVGSMFLVGLGWFIVFGILWDPCNFKHWLASALPASFFLPLGIHMCGWLTFANVFFFAPLGFFLGALASPFGHYMDRVSRRGGSPSWTSGGSSSSWERSTSSSSSSGSGGGGGGSFSGGGGRFGGGGASGSW